MLSLNHPIAALKGADYNPRRIDPGAEERLRQSIRTIGVVKPIIVRHQTIVAGHQRTKALRALGIDHAPCFLLSTDTTAYDEVRFNQLHNGTDLDLEGETVRVPLHRVTARRGFVEVPPDEIDGNMLSPGAKIRAEICRLVQAYGPWGAAVATDDGEVIHCGQYALACKMMGKPCLVAVLPVALKSEARALLSSRYGVFNYDHIKRDTFVQTFAQLFRLRGGKKDNESPTYEQLVKPWLRANPKARLLDFGCGQGDYVRALRKEGYDVTGLEFFRRTGDAIDVAAVNRMVDSVIHQLNRHGPFDAVVMDYVLNSVDSQQAEDDVLDSIDALCRVGGTLFFSGRSMSRIEELARHRKAHYRRQMQRNVEFLDEHNLSALYRKGSWFFQKFHAPEDVDRIIATRGWVKQRESQGNRVGWNIQVAKPCKCARVEDAIQALRREFDMPVNRDGRRLGRADDIENAIRPWLQ